MSTRRDPGLYLAELLPAVERAFSRWVDSLLEGDGLSPSRVRLLAALMTGGPQTMTALSIELDVVPRTVTALVDGLESDELVRRTPHPSDRRSTVVELTPKGRTVFCEMCEPHAEKVGELFRDLPLADRRELVRLLEALLSAIHKRGGPSRST